MTACSHASIPITPSNLSRRRPRCEVRRHPRTLTRRRNRYEIWGVSFLTTWGNDVTEDDPTDDDFQNPKHWRALAEETREKANDMASPELKERMLLIAADYDQLAERAERGPGKSDAARN